MPRCIDLIVYCDKIKLIDTNPSWKGLVNRLFNGNWVEEDNYKREVHGPGVLLLHESMPKLLFPQQDLCVHQDLKLQLEESGFSFEWTEVKARYIYKCPLTLTPWENEDLKVPRPWITDSFRHLPIEKAVNDTPPYFVLNPQLQCLLIAPEIDKRIQKQTVSAHEQRITYRQHRKQVFLEEFGILRGSGAFALHERVYDILAPYVDQRCVRVEFNPFDE